MTRHVRAHLGASVPLALLTLTASLVVLACGGETRKAASTTVADAAARSKSCNRGDTTATYLAYREFIRITVPTPQRFLTAAGTDSAAADDGFRAMQDKGPSYFYGGDSVARRKIREKLASVGPYASLLIVHRGTTTAPTGDTVTVHLGGHYIGGELEGKDAMGKTLVVVCAADAWKIASTADEKTP